MLLGFGISEEVSSYSLKLFIVLNMIYEYGDKVRIFEESIDEFHKILWFFCLLGLWFDDYQIH